MLQYNKIIHNNQCNTINLIITQILYFILCALKEAINFLHLLILTLTLIQNRAKLAEVVQASTLSNTKKNNLCGLLGAHGCSPIF